MFTSTSIPTDLSVTDLNRKLFPYVIILKDDRRSMSRKNRKLYFSVEFFEKWPAVTFMKSSSSILTCFGSSWERFNSMKFQLFSFEVWGNFVVKAKVLWNFRSDINFSYDNRYLDGSQDLFYCSHKLSSQVAHITSIHVHTFHSTLC